MSQNSYFWMKYIKYREPLEVLADNGILNRADFYEFIKNSTREKLIEAPDIYEHSHHYKLIKGYKVNYNNDLVMIGKDTADKIEVALKKINIDYSRDVDFLSIVESWNQIESNSYMHIYITKQ